MRLLFASDLHGSTTCFKKFIAASQIYDVDILVLGGDLCAKALVPIYVSGQKAEFDIFGRTLTETGKGCINRAVQRIEQVGLYAQVLQSPVDVETTLDSRHLESNFQAAIMSRLRSWATHAAEMLERNEKIYVIPGNDDHPCIDAILNDENVFVSVDRRIVEIREGFVICGLGVSNETPWNTYRELSEKEIANELESLMANVPTDAKCIWNVHVPPAGLGIDICDALDAEEKRSWLASMSPHQVSVGSASVAAAIRKYQPLLGLFGHVHEGRGIVSLGETLCVNPGSEYYNSVLHAAVVDICDSMIVRSQLIAG